MNFYQWHKSKYGFSEPMYGVEYRLMNERRDGWNAALEHARDEFLQREIDRIKNEIQDARAAEDFEIGYVGISGDYYESLGVVCRHLEYLKEQK